MTTVPDDPGIRATHEPDRRRDGGHGGDGASTREALLRAARPLLASPGPHGTSIRRLAAASGRSHALIPRHFGSKSGLELAVVQGLAGELYTEVDAAVDAAGAAGGDPWAEVLARARRDPVVVHLIVRCGLGDLPIGPLLAEGGPARRLAEVLGAAPEASDRTGLRRSQVCTFVALSLLLGWLTFDGFIIEAARLAPVAQPRRDAAIATAITRVASMAHARAPELRTSPRTPRAAPSVSLAHGDPSRGSRIALVEAAATLFALRGPAAVSVREIARHAGVNHGLVHRHFGSKEALVAEAIERGSLGLFPAALSEAGFDLDTVVRQVRHESLAPVLIARTLVDDLEMAMVRDRFPVVRRLVDAYPSVPVGAGRGGLGDPRLAVAAAVSVALGSTIWDAPLRTVTGIGADVDLDLAVADIARYLLDLPHHSAPVVQPHR